MKNLAIFFAFLVTQSAFARPLDQQAETQPYLDELKQKHGIKPPVQVPIPPSIPYDQMPKDTFETDPEKVQPYIESLKRNSAPTSEDPFAIQPHLESLKAGHELKPQYRKTVNQSAGFAIVAKNNFSVTSDSVQANKFDDVYEPGNKYAPSFDFYYERQLLRNEYAGTFGPVFHLGFISIVGKGLFTRRQVRSDDTLFKFRALPMSVGGSYRFILGRFFVPFAQASAMAIPFMETRNDDHPHHRGISQALALNAGLSLNLDWIGRKNAWALYDAHGILHTYLVVQYMVIRSVASAVDFDYDGVYAGLSFEF